MMGSRADLGCPRKLPLSPPPQPSLLAGPTVAVILCAGWAQQELKNCPGPAAASVSPLDPKGCVGFFSLSLSVFTSVPQHSFLSFQTTPECILETSSSVFSSLLKYF